VEARRPEIPGLRDGSEFEADIDPELRQDVRPPVVPSSQRIDWYENRLAGHWEQVDLERKQAWIHPDQAKSRRAIPVPLNDVAIEVLRRQVGNHFLRVFTFEGEPVRQVNTKAWRKALKRARIQDFRWHDLWHTWATWHVKKGTPLFALQELAGWESECMVRRYAHLAANHLAPYSEKVGTLGTSWAQAAGFPVASGKRQPKRLKLKRKLVTRGGIEPPTRGFSMLTSVRRAY
jgi:Phage integrase family